MIHKVKDKKAWYYDCDRCGRISPKYLAPEEAEHMWLEHNKRCPNK